MLSFCCNWLQFQNVVQVFSLNKCSCTPSVCWIYLITFNVVWSIWVGKSSTLSQCTHQKENFYSIFQHRTCLLTSGENCKTENYATIGKQPLCAFLRVSKLFPFKICFRQKLFELQFESLLLVNSRLKWSLWNLLIVEFYQII